MLKLKLFFVFLMVDVAVLLLPFVVLLLIVNTNYTMDFAYFAWYLLIIPMISNLITLYFVRKESVGVIYTPLSIVFCYIASYYFYITFVSVAFSNFNPVI
jgi:hypothetical protein